MRPLSKKAYIAAVSGLATLAAAVTLVAPGLSQPAPRPTAKPAAQMKFGVYDPEGVFAGDKSVGIEHVYIPWRDSDPTSLAKADAYAREHRRDLMVTVEPWSWSPAANVPSEQLLHGILAGAYDGPARSVCSEIGKLGRPVTIRWAQEMDLPNGHFPWSSWAPSDYVAAYRHFVTQCRIDAPQARFMWSPRGEERLAAYYPGDAYVDEIGLTVLDLQQYDLDQYGHARSFKEALGPAYKRVVGFGKPIVVAELGFQGDSAFMEQWLQDSRAPGGEFPQLVAVVYFNATDPYAWPEPYGRPDWRLQRGFVN